MERLWGVGLINRRRKVRVYIGQGPFSNVNIGTLDPPPKVENLIMLMYLLHGDVLPLLTRPSGLFVSRMFET